MQNRSLSEQLRALAASGQVPPPVPAFRLDMPDKAWADSLRALSQLVREQRPLEGVFPVQDGRLVIRAVHRAKQLSSKDRLSQEDRFLAIYSLLRQHRRATVFLCRSLGEALFDLERGSSIPESDQHLVEAAADDIRQRDEAGAFERMRRELARSEAEARARETAQREAARIAQERLLREQEARRRAERRDAVLAELRGLANTLRSRELDGTVPAWGLQPAPVDLRLAVEWSPPAAFAWLSDRIRASGGDWTGFGSACQSAESRRRSAEGAASVDDGSGVAISHLKRNLSARLAERAVRWFIERRMAAHSVQDVSEGQGSALLRSPVPRRKPFAADADTGAQDWHTHDLLVTGPGGRAYPVDVKNARTTYLEGQWGEDLRSRPERWSYREHYVPRFKKGRGARQGGTTVNVLIAGAISAGSPLSQLLHGSGESVCLLGVTSARQIRRLERTFCIKGFLELRLGAGARVRRCDPDSVFVPPWMFAVPSPLSAETRRLQDRARELFGSDGELLGNPEPGLIQLYIASGASAVLPAWADALTQPWAAFVRGLSRNIRALGLTLPVVYLSILRHFLETIRERGPAGLDPRRYEALLYGPGTGTPLGLYDPTGSVRSLIQTLRALVEACPDSLQAFTAFQFAQTGVLKGLEPRSDRWRTILFPYCGGSGCKRLNLALGKDGVISCPECGYLRCSSPGCGYCSRQCEQSRAQETEEAADLDGEDESGRAAEPAQVRTGVHGRAVP